MAQNIPDKADTSRIADKKLSRIEFVLLMAALMSASALSIDPMLPALPDIGRDLHVLHDNDRQSIITLFFLGLAGGALFYGPLSDHYGRRPVLIVSMLLLFVTTVVCAVAPSFSVMLTARFLAGFFAASCRVMVVSIVRDCYRGDAMARIMSLIMFIFMIVPILAPTFGTVVLMFAPWRWIFWILAAIIGAVMFWLTRRLPETLRQHHRVHIRPRDLASTFKSIVTHRSSIGYMIASGIMMGGLVGFLVSVQQIFFDVFHKPHLLPLGFAAISVWMAVGSLGNSHLVHRFGARRLSQSAVITIMLLSVIHCVVTVLDAETILIFILIQGMTTMCFSFAGANFSAISLEPFSRGAGLASSLNASLTTLISTVLGGFIGASFDGTTLPIGLGFLTFSTSALLVILWAERGRLFTRPGNAYLREEM